MRTFQLPFGSRSVVGDYSNDAVCFYATEKFRSLCNQHRGLRVLITNMSRKKFVILFVISAFIFMFISNALFGTDARVFPQPPESFLGTEPTVAWKSVGYNVLLPIKLVLVGPMLFTGTFLREDPPPPLVGIVFAFDWSILALVIYYILDKIKLRKAQFPSR
jgi:hypothetical protein